MKKLSSLRAAILAAPLKITDKALLTFAEKGTAQSWRRQGGEGNKAFQVAYTAHLIVTDYTGAPQDLFFAVIDWLERECPDAGEEAFRFHVDQIDHKKADVSLAVNITEIIATPDAGDGAVRLVPAATPNAAGMDMTAFFPDLA